MKLTFRTKLFLPLAISLICLFLVMTLSVLQNRALRLEERKVQLSNAADIAQSVAKEYADLAASGAISEAEAKKQTLSRIKALRYGQSGYFTVFDSDKVLMNPIKLELIGTKVSSFKDAQGAPFLVNAINEVKEKGAGFIEFMWAKPGSQQPVPKLSYSLGYKPWGWTFMTGLYIDDVNNAFIKDLWQSVSLLVFIVFALSSIVFLILRSIENSIGGEPGYVKDIADNIAAGNLTVSVNLKNNDQTSILHAIKVMRDNLADIVGKVRRGTDTIATASIQIATGNLDLSSRTEEQAGSLEETAASMEELTSTVKQNSDNARQANHLAVSASDVAIRGGAVVSQVVDTMASINDSSKKIVDIISVIDGIAFQTNILALNAAVEAARAGEQGRGFAVVASEVRNLAQRSAAAAKEIKTLIGDSVNKVAAGSRLVAEAGTTMDEVVASVRRVTDIMSEITAASQEQSAGIEQVNQAIAQMDEVTQQNAALVEEAAAAAESLQDQASNLSQVVNVFVLDGVHAVRPPATSLIAAPARKRPKAAPARIAPATSRSSRSALMTTAASADEWDAF